MVALWGVPFRMQHGLQLVIVFSVWWPDVFYYLQKLVILFGICVFVVPSILAQLSSSVLVQSVWHKSCIASLEIWMIGLWMVGQL